MSSTPFHVEPPEAFNFAETQTWPRWIRRWERFRVVSGLDGKPEAFQINSLIYAMGDEADDILASLPLSDADKEHYETVREALESHFVGRHNVVLERARFNRRVQDPGEPAESFVKAVHGLAERCKFGSMKEELIRDRIVVGIRDVRLSERLQRDANLTLAKTVALVRQQESVRRPLEGPRGQGNDGYPLPGHPDSARNFDYKKKGQRVGPSPHGPVQNTPPRLYTNNKDGRKKYCNRCGRYPPHSWTECPARDIECRKCQKRGHFASSCRSQPNEVVAVAQQDGASGDGGFHFLGGAMGNLKLSEAWQAVSGQIQDGKPGVKKNAGRGTASPTSYQAKRSSGNFQKPGPVLCGQDNPPVGVPG